MGRPKGSKNKPKVATPEANKVEQTEKKRRPGRPPKNKSNVVNVSETKVQTTSSVPVKVDLTPVENLVKEVYKIMPQEQKLRWQQPSDDPSLQTPEQKITSVLAVFFGLKENKI